MVLKKGTVIVYHKPGLQLRLVFVALNLLSLILAYDQEIR